MFWYIVIATIPAGILALVLDKISESIIGDNFKLEMGLIAAALVLVDLTEFALTSIPFWVGVLSSFIVGLIVVKFLMDYLKKGSFKIFAIYRIILGIIIFALIFIR